MSYAEDYALYANPEKTMEIIEQIKSILPEEAIATLGALTNRDLCFYLVGCQAGLKKANTSFDAFFGEVVAKLDTLIS